MSTWSREITGHEGVAIEVGYATEIGYFTAVEGMPSRVGLTLWQLVDCTRNYMVWTMHKQLFRVLQAAPVLIQAQNDPHHPTAAIVKQLCA